MRVRYPILVAILAATLPSIALAGPTDPAGTPLPTATWATSMPEAQGMESNALARLVDAAGAYRQDSLLVVRHGRIVLDVAYTPYEAGIPHDLRSITKSVIGTLTAIEVQRGLLDSVDHPVVDLLADLPIEHLDDDKRAMTTAASRSRRLTPSAVPSASMVCSGRARARTTGSTPSRDAG